MFNKTQTAEQVTKLIQDHWGITHLRPLQAEAIEADVLARDSLVIMPTGGGKSLCYQAPAAARDGLTVVISPLISLMTDQVNALNDRGIPAAMLTSDQHPQLQDHVVSAVKAGKTRLLYVAPERLNNPAFLSLCVQARLDAIIVDEAHCISLWGHSFRPDYRRLALLRDVAPIAVVHAYSATATPQVRDDICKHLNLYNPAVLVGDFDRPTLRLKVEQRVRDHNFQLLTRVLSHAGEPGIVYCTSRLETVRIVKILEANGVNAAFYHAGMEGHARSQVQESFMAGDVDVIVATIAFGMGIDKPDVRYMIHTGMPSSMEVYHQEIGRAGRDGKPSECVVFWHPDDYDNWQLRLWHDTHLGEPADTLYNHYITLLDSMEAYCRNVERQCRHVALAEYFGQRDLTACRDACDVCCQAVELRVTSDELRSGSTLVPGWDAAHELDSAMATEDA